MAGQPGGRATLNDRIGTTRYVGSDGGRARAMHRPAPPGPEAAWEYAPAPESREIVSIAPGYGLFINGEFTPAADGKHFTTLNPATEEPLAEAAEAGERDVDRAVAAARTAFERNCSPMHGTDLVQH